MKKYLFGIFAIVLAIGFSAFTANHKPVTKTDAAQVNLFWYAVNSSNQVIGTPFNATAESKTTAVSTAYLGCDDTADEVICLYGDESDELATPISLPSSAAAVTIKEKE